MLGNLDIGGGEISALEDELVGLPAVSAPVTPARCGFLRRSVARVMLRSGAESVLIVDPATPAVQVPTRAFIRALRTEEMIGEIRQSDLMALIDPVALETASFALPLKQHVRVVRFAATAREHVFTAPETPQQIGFDGCPVLIRAIIRG